MRGFQSAYIGVVVRFVQIVAVSPSLSSRIMRLPATQDVSVARS